MEDPHGERKGAQSDRSHLRNKPPGSRTNAATPVDIKFQGSSPVPTNHPRSRRPSTARVLSTGRASTARRTEPPLRDINGTSSSRAATVAAIYLGQFHSGQSPQKTRGDTREAEARSQSDSERRPDFTRRERWARRATVDGYISAPHDGDRASAEPYRRRSAEHTREQMPITGKPSTKRAENGRPTSREENPVHPRPVPPLKLLGNIFASSQVPKSLKPLRNPSPSEASSTARNSHRTPMSSRAAEVGENSPPQAHLKLQNVQCSREIAEAFRGRKNTPLQANEAVQHEVVRPLAERAALTVRNIQETNREAALKVRPQTARQMGVNLRVAVPKRAPVAINSQPAESEVPVVQPAWADWQPPLPVRTVRSLSLKKADEAKPMFTEKQSPSPPTVLFHPSSPNSSVCSLDLANERSDCSDSCQRRRTAVKAQEEQNHMSISQGTSRASYLRSSSPQRFGRLSSGNTLDSSEEKKHASGSLDFGPQDELEPFSFRSAPVTIPSLCDETPRVTSPLIQSPPNLPRHLIQHSNPCSPNLSRGFMIGQFDGHVPATSARDEPLSTRVSNGALPCLGVPRPGLAQQLHESLNNPNALPGYSVGPVIGEGGFCKVRLGTHLVSGEKVAIKVIDKTRLTDPTDRKRVAREIRVLKKLDQAHIIRLLEVGEASSRIHVIMEHASGGTLLDYVRKKKRLSEPEARGCLRQILVGLAYCHSKGVIHRDIKLENLLLSADREMKIIDFGLSAILVPGKKLRVHCGSPSYAAPEIVLRQLYDGPPVDVWSLGVVLFAMITGYLPFHSSGSNKDELCQKIIAGAYKTPEGLSGEATDLLRGMLTTDPRRRLTVEQVAEHPWVRGHSEPCWRLPSLTDEPECRPPLDPAILSSISKRIDTMSLSESILRGDHTYFTAMYHLLATKASFKTPRTCPDSVAVNGAC